MCSGFGFQVSSFQFQIFSSSPRRCPTSVARVAGEMITKILRLIPNFPLVTIYALPATASSPLALRLKNLIDETKFHPSGSLRQSFSASLRFLKLKTRSFLPQNESQSRFAWQSEFLFIREKSKLTLSPPREVRLPNRAFSSVGYDTMTSMYDTPVRRPATREPSRFSSI